MWPLWFCIISTSLSFLVTVSVYRDSSSFPQPLRVSVVLAKFKLWASWTFPLTGKHFHCCCAYQLINPSLSSLIPVWMEPSFYHPSVHAKYFHSVIHINYLKISVFIFQTWTMFHISKSRSSHFYSILLFTEESNFAIFLFAMFLVLIWMPPCSGLRIDSSWFDI